MSYVDLVILPHDISELLCTNLIRPCGFVYSAIMLIATFFTFVVFPYGLLFIIASHIKIFIYIF